MSSNILAPTFAPTLHGVEKKSLSQVSKTGSGRRLTTVLSLAAVDAAVSAIAVQGGSILIGDQSVGLKGQVPDFILIPALACAIYAAAGLYGGYGPSPAERLRLRTGSIAILIFGCCVFQAGDGLTMAEIACSGMTALLLLILGFYAEVVVRRILIRRRLWGATTAIVGTDACGIALANALLAQPELGFNPVGFINVAEGAGRSGTGDDTPLPVLGSLEDAARLRPGIEVAVFCSCVDFTVNDLAHPGPLPFPKVVVAQQIQDLQSLWLQTRTLGGVVGIEIRRDLYRTGNLRLKRMMDALLAMPALLLAAPVIGILALAIKLIDPGPAFYGQMRVGRNGRPIRVLKLRSMYRDAEKRLDDHLAAKPEAHAEWHRFFKLANDPRILPGIGTLIRRSSLDELPQLWNVVRGDISLVGPRPFPSYHTDRFDPDFQALRSSVSPGLTGLWQVSSRSDGDLSVQKSQDSFYIRNWSIWLDLYILLATVPAVFSGSGAR
ncbi:exopolysaccharide biosynthesis polyprenyl glycosylphosphotransferase [Methylobacterium marchantiae]|uniref:Exopolysaccharide biosynthesis polyprenyl glycosylphosphotransferase n=1 Tax=Methylobacterium marchantiae TaxID=600331 RepID=A0ABW3X3C2_9HYPH|nr:hypothetical protein AIGOOFII_3177 [Methylobacterium marchantiae]